MRTGGRDLETDLSIAPAVPVDGAGQQIDDGHDWMHALDGRMRLLLGDQDLAIEAGESVESRTLTPHWFGAIGGAVDVIAVFGPHGERTHLHP